MIFFLIFQSVKKKFCEYCNSDRTRSRYSFYHWNKKRIRLIPLKLFKKSCQNERPLKIFLDTNIFKNIFFQGQNIILNFIWQLHVKIQLRTDLMPKFHWDWIKNEFLRLFLKIIPSAKGPLAVPPPLIFQGILLL